MPGRPALQLLERGRNNGARLIRIEALRFLLLALFCFSCCLAARAADEPGTRSAVIRTGDTPGVRYMSGLTVCDEQLRNGRWVGRYWGSNGQIVPDFHLEDERAQMDMLPIDAFNLEIEGQTTMPLDPAKPAVFSLYNPFCIPGIPFPDQCRAARMQPQNPYAWLSLADFELSLGPSGCDSVASRRKSQLHTFSRASSTARRMRYSTSLLSFDSMPAI